MESLERVIQFLRLRNRHVLANLLLRAHVSFDVSTSYGSHLFSKITMAEIYAPLPDYDRLRALSSEDEQRILDALLEIWPPRARDMEINGVTFKLDPDSLMDQQDDTEELLQQADRLRSIMIEVSTGGPLIKTLSVEFKTVYWQLAQRLEDRGIRNPVPYSDLWDWHRKWSSGDLPTYRSRREYVNGLFEALAERLRVSSSARGAEVFPEPTGWPRIDRTLDEARTQLASASTEEQFQTVGLLCREVLISLAQTVYDPDRHPSPGGLSVSETDAKRMLDGYLAVEISGGSNAAARKHAKASLDLANELQHERTAEFRKARLCAEATASVVNIVAILSGIRDP